MELTLYTDETGFAALKPEWNDLLRRSRFDTIFLTCEWQTTWWTHLGKQRGPLYILAAREDGRTVGILPLYATEETTAASAERVLHVVGCIEVSDYLDFIIEEGREEAVYAAFLDWLAGPDAPPWNGLDLCNQPGPSLAHTRLADMARAAGYKVTVAQEDVCPIIDLPKAADCTGDGAPAGGNDAWEQYLGTLDKKERHEIRRKLRRIERDAPGANVRSVAGGDDLAKDVAAFIGLHRNSRADKHAFMTDEMQAYFRAIAQVLAEQGWLQLSFLDIDGQPVASYFCFDYRDEILVYNSGYDPGAVPQLSPGWVLLAQVIQHAIGLCRSKFDFLQGDEDYKHRFGGVDTPVFRTYIERAQPGATMRVIAGSAKGRPLAAVPGESTRPITDRVKAALFSILNSLDMIEDRRYLDLFGGTGAVGIEALSRGAAEVVFCERDRQALRTLQHNLETTRLSDQATVIPGDAFAYLQRADPAPFDVIYIAPPQYKGLWLAALQAVDARPGLLTPDGTAIVQVFPKEWSAPPLASLTLNDRRKYGSTELFFYGRSSQQDLE